MIFIVGTGRCGTHLLRDMLNLHRDVYIPQETQWIPKMYEFYGLACNPFEQYVDIIERTHFYHENALTIDVILEDFEISKHEFYRLVKSMIRNLYETNTIEVNQAIYQVLAKLKGKTIYGEKTPEYGLYMHDLQRIWPESRFLNVIRNGRDVALSMSKHGGYRKMASLRIINWCPVSFDSYYRINDINPPIILKKIGSLFPESVRSIGKAILYGKRETNEKESLVPFIDIWSARIKKISDESTRLKKGSYFEVKYENILNNPQPGPQGIIIRRFVLNQLMGKV